MRVALAYDEPLKGDLGRTMPDDMGAEYEDEAAITGLLDAIRSCGHEPLKLPFGQDFPARACELAPEMVFNITEGLRGPMRESIVPAWLDHLGIAYTGSDGLTLALTLDKAWIKRIVSGYGVRTPRFRRVRQMEELSQLDLTYPLFVKPNSEGSSMGVRRCSKVSSPTQLKRQVAWALRTYRQDCLVEEFAPGAEFCVGILGNDEPEVLPIAEVRTEGGFYSYESKSCHEKEIICPAKIDEVIAGELREAAVTIFRNVRCRDFARLDFKIDVSGQVSFLEINPLPGLAASYSIFPLQARAKGISQGALIGAIIDLALRRGRQLQEISA